MKLIINKFIYAFPISTPFFYFFYFIFALGLKAGQIIISIAIANYRLIHGLFHISLVISTRP
jgi:hypothetical protein